MSSIWNEDDATPHFNVSYTMCTCIKAPCFKVHAMYNSVYNFSNVHGLHQGITRLQYVIIYMAFNSLKDV